jgi:hypothetical protein
MSPSPYINVCFGLGSMQSPDCFFIPVSVLLVPNQRFQTKIKAQRFDTLSD